MRGDANDARMQPAAVVALDAVVFVLGVGLLGAALWWWGRKIFKEE